MNTHKTTIPADLLPQLDTLLMIVSERSGIAIEQLTGTSRKREVVDARRVFTAMAMKYARFVKQELYRTAYVRPPAFIHIGKFLGNKDHSSIHNLYGKDGQTVADMCRYDKTFEQLHASIEYEVTKGYKAPVASEV